MIDVVLRLLVGRGVNDDIAASAIEATEKLTRSALIIASRGPIDDLLEGFRKRPQSPK